MNETEKLVDFFYSSLQAVRRAQKYYLAFLLALLTFVWVSYWGKPKAGPISFFGMPLSDNTLLGVTPGVSTILLLGLMGCLRAIEPALQRFRHAWMNAGGTAEVSLEVVDNHRNWVDYSIFLWSNFFSYLIYGAVQAAALSSTLAIGLLLIPKFKGYDAFFFASYCLLCLAAQAAASWKWVTGILAVSRRKASEPSVSRGHQTIGA